MIFMDLTLVTFEDIAELNKSAWDRIRMKRNPQDTYMVRTTMLTFKQITKIEAMRLEIEELQKALNNYKEAMRFGCAPSISGLMCALPVSITPYLREALCKSIVVEILKLLDDCDRLGVDTEPSKKVLMEVLESMKVSS